MTEMCDRYSTLNYTYNKTVQEIHIFASTSRILHYS